jgi:hypothetical protein
MANRNPKPARALPSETEPLVSIGLPTYNGASHLGEALECLTGQDYPNLEIIVSDNASNDDTLAIAESFAKRDARLRVVRQATNVGPTENFNLVFRQTTGPLFMWAADDDRWEPDYVSACVTGLNANPKAVMACTSVRFVVGGSDESSDEFVAELFDNPDLSSPDPAVRIGRLMSRGGWFQIYGLARRSALEATRQFSPGFGSDVVLTVELATQGPIILVPRPLFVFRVVRGPRDPDRGVWNQDVVGLPKIRETAYSQLQEACTAAIAQSGLAWWQRQRARGAVLIACYVRPTPMRAHIRPEVDTRFRLALAGRDLPAILKYGIVGVAIRLRRLFVRSAA